MTRILTFLVAVFFATSHAQAADVLAHELLFREGTLDALGQDEMLIYDRVVTNALKTETAERDSGEIELSFKEKDVRTAHVEFRQGEKHRPMGEFPASIGNPMIMIFLETTVRDMTENVGGSPFYIRNRVKEAMAAKMVAEPGTAEYQGKEIATQTLTFQPFAGDKNRDKMKDFGDLELRIVMSEDLPGWYQSLSAKAGDAYQTSFQFKGVKTAQ